MQIDLEAIVREVMRRLERELAPGDHAPTSLLPPKSAGGAERDSVWVAGAERDSRPAATPEVPKHVQPQRSAGAERGFRAAATLEVTERVVTWTRLKDRLAGIKRLVVPPGAVLTPSVRDELRKRNIQIQTANGANQPAGAASARLLIAATTGPYDAEAAIKIITAEAGNAERIGTGVLAEAIGQLRGRAEAVPAVLLTSEPTAAVCLANRYSELRAVWATDAAMVSLACQSIGVNLLILNPVRSNANEVRGMVRQFLQGSHQCPADWQTLLAEPRSR
ncbi:MAG: hypothetical protein KJ000_00690 [Pirellulaceae bacterium]|nr:hypothetical protein [Pirellulaceae bacterium]